ncbi:carboxypeptidase-like regulatory domain-containing protein [Myxococcus stipitatus]|uniref:MSCRAMM family protein n=1 Tax=Myxococcus stipitatus TaxID=83455 RepID=UPI001F367F1D|nr:carboxypeptidase-like regulatory domain-containing protein [Myxococcus stipitatus]MCE9667305.1 carboxypeptidase-like regulatory domain-containing protein [Myxococcus stipitatus]
MPEQEDAFLEGTVLSAEGERVRGCHVRVEQGSDTLSEVSDDQGRFRLVVATGKDLTLSAECESQAAPAVSMRLETDRQVTLRLAPTRGLRVLVRAQRGDTPVPGANVQLLRAGTPVGMATADANGLATLRSAAFADRLRVSAPGYLLQDLPPRGWGEAQSDAAPLVVRLASSAALTVEVLDERGAPARGATVRLTPMLGIRGDTLSRATGDDGRVVWDDLPQSTFDIEASHPELGMGRAPVLSWTGARAVSLQVRLGSGPAIAGRVLDATREPVADATVVLKRRVEFGVSPEHAVRTDGHGQFRVAGVVAGAYLVHARKEGQASAPLAVQGGDEGVELTLREARDIEGHVVTRTGQDVSRAVLALRTTGGNTVLEKQADEQGRFRLEGFGDGRFELSAARATGGGRVTKSVSAGEKVVLVLPDEGSLRGRVRTTDNRPLSAVTVSFVSHGERIAQVMDGGEFHVTGVPSGSVALEVRAPGYAASPLRTATVVESSESDAGEFILAPGGTLEGMVVDANGQPVGEATVHAGSRIIGTAYSLVSEDAALLGQTTSTRTAPNGSFRLENLPPEAKVLAAEHPTLGRSTPTPLSGTQPVLKLLATGRVAGTIQMGGQPSAGLLIVVLLNHLTTVQLTATTDSSGAFQVDGLPVGEHSVGVSLIRNGTPSTRALKKVRIEAGQTTRLDLSIPLGEGSVRVVYRDARPDEARMRVVLSGPMMDSRLLSAEGTATFSSLSPGAYNICLLVSPTTPRCTPVTVSERAEEVVF